MMARPSFSRRTFAGKFCRHVQPIPKIRTISPFSRQGFVYQAAFAITGPRVVAGDGHLADRVGQRLRGDRPEPRLATISSPLPTWQCWRSEASSLCSPNVKESGNDADADGRTAHMPRL
jgi:hypothetical protein